VSHIMTVSPAAASLAVDHIKVGEKKIGDKNRKVLAVPDLART
jgi:hypothetical protein